MKENVKWIGACLIAWFCIWGNVAAEEIIDADYNAEVLSAMRRGEAPQVQVVQGSKSREVQMIETDKVCYTTDVLTVRELPEKESRELTQIAQYAKIQVNGVCENGWSKVILESGMEGYVSNEFLSDIVPAGAEKIGESLGLFTVTYYCSCELCCGWWAGSPTASGAYPTADWTIAADPDILPIGTKVYINGHEYCVEDTGTGVDGYHIDIYVDDHQRAVHNGMGMTEVFAAKE